MKSFKDWVDGQEEDSTWTRENKWKATKPQIMEFWKGLQENVPIQINPIGYDHKGSTYAEDGVRITGSKEFIASILSRLKELLVYESPSTKLNLVYRETDRKNSQTPDINTYVFYVQAKERGQR